MKTTVILDLEWTSWKYNVDRKWQKKEIIQIGAIKINNKYKIIGEINIYVKPKFNPILSNLGLDPILLNFSDIFFK